MALVKFGAGVSEMRGKEGGVIYSRNAYGAYMKTKVSPTNPQTSYQQTQRSLMGTLAQLWATLSAANKAGWDSLGDQVTRINVFGDQTTYKGFGLFMRLNRNLQIIGEDPITTAPTLPTFSNLELTAMSANATTPAITLTFTPTPLQANEYLVVYATPNIVTGRTFVKNLYRFILADDAAASVLNIYDAAWISRYPEGLTVGAKIFVKAKIIDDASGFDSVPAVISATVVS